MLVPKLRFKEFTDEWQTKKLDSLFNVITDFVAAGSFADLRNNVEYNSCIDYAQLIRTIDIKNKFNNKDFVYINEKAYNFLWRVNLDKDAIILPNIGANIGERYYIDYKKLPYNKSALGPNAILLRSTNYNLKYLFNLFNTKSFEVQLKNIVGASGQPKFNKTDLKKFSFNISNNENEQNKIAKFISLIDKKIELQSKKIEVLKLYSESAKYKIMYIKDDLKKEYSLSKLLEESINKSTINNQHPIISSTSKGIFLQEEYFNKQAASINNIGYKIIKKNQLVLSPQNLWMGNININYKYDVGIVSPSYKIFNVNTDVCNIDYFNEWIKSKDALYKYSLISEQGASIVRRNLNISLFNNIKVFLPDLDNQKKIGDFFKSLNKKKYNEENKLVLLKKLKKGLMQSMFV